MMGGGARRCDALCFDIHIYIYLSHTSLVISPLLRPPKNALNPNSAANPIAMNPTTRYAVPRKAFFPPMEDSVVTTNDLVPIKEDTGYTSLISNRIGTPAAAPFGSEPSSFRNVGSAATRNHTITCSLVRGGKVLFSGDASVLFCSATAKSAALGALNRFTSDAHAMPVSVRLAGPPTSEMVSLKYEFAINPQGKRRMDVPGRSLSGSQEETWEVVYVNAPVVNCWLEKEDTNLRWFCGVGRVLG